MVDGPYEISNRPEHSKRIIRWRLLRVLGFGLALVIAIWIAAAAFLATSPPSISLKHVYHTGAQSMLWVSNQCDNPVTISVETVEAKSGANWVLHARVGKPLWISTSGGQAKLQLGPHESIFVSTDLGTKPPTVPWRIALKVHRHLQGFEATLARIVRFPSLLRFRMQSGNTSIPLNPLSPGMTPFATPVTVTTQEILPEQPDRSTR